MIIYIAMRDTISCNNAKKHQDQNLFPSVANRTLNSLAA